MARYGYNYFAPTPPKKLRRQVAADVNAQIAPYLTQLNKRYAAGSQTHQIYADAQARDAALNAALSQQLTGQGNQLASSLSSTLGQAGQSTSGVAGLAGIGQGAAGAGSALGAANIARLIAQGAANENYSAQLPNLARLAGAQQQQNYRGQIETQRQGILEKVPGLIATTTEQAQNRELQKGIAVQSGLIDQQKLKLDTAYKTTRLDQAQQTINLRAEQNRINNLYKQAGLNISQGQLDIAQQRERRLQRGKAGKTKNAYTPLQISKFRSTAIDTVKDWKHGIPGTTYADGSVKSKGIGGRPKDPRGAFRYLVNHGIPPSMADWAVGQVYGKWKAPGEGSKRGPTGSGPR